MPTYTMLRRLLLLGLLVAMNGWARENGSGWLEVRSPHFTVITNAGEGRGRHVAGQFERMRWVFQSSLPASANLDPANSIVVIAVKDRKGMEALEPAPYLAKGQVSLAGLFSQSTDKNYILVRLDGEGEHPYSTVYHEYTHLMEANSAEWMPLWLNEGLAEFFQNTEIRDKEVLLGEPSMSALLLLQQNRLIPLPVLFKVDAASPYYHEEGKGGMFYAEAWALTHYLEVADFHDHGNRIGKYLALTSRGTDAVTAAVQAFGDLNKLQEEIESYTREGRYSFFQKSTEQVRFDERSYAVAALSVADADAVRADFLAYMQRPDDARAKAEAALQADAKSAKAHEAMGRIEYAEGHRAEARKWYGEAAALDPDDFVAQYFTGMLAVMAGEEDAEAESHLRAAIRVNPRFAPAYDALAALLTNQASKLGQAHMMELQAVALDPGNLHYRLSTAQILMAQEQFDGALEVLGAAKTLARDPLEVQVVERMEKQVGERRAQVESFRLQEAEAKARAMESLQATAANPGDGVEGTGKPMGLPQKPKHATETPHGPDLWVTGVIRDVHCSWPGQMELRVEGEKRRLTLYNNDAYSIDYRALDFTPKEAIHPCQDLEGRKARVHYFATADKSVDGQITVIALWK